MSDKRDVREKLKELAQSPALLEAAFQKLRDSVADPTPERQARIWASVSTAIDIEQVADTTRSKTDACKSFLADLEVAVGRLIAEALPPLGIAQAAGSTEEIRLPINEEEFVKAEWNPGDGTLEIYPHRYDDTVLFLCVIDPQFDEPIALVEESNHVVHAVHIKSHRRTVHAVALPAPERPTFALFARS